MFNNHPFMFELNRFFHTYYLFLGLDQNFAVFAPVPRQRNPHLTALVHYKDGTTLLWNAPRMERLGFLEKIPAERYRKFYDDNTVWEHIPNFCQTSLSMLLAIVTLIGIIHQTRYH
ncbi:MAG: hypothetical protein IPJ49_07840 [Candidatus Obscuribacter sp.]|nr:hypothetical protein [Candidatus Obscuribacter sp.]